MLAMVLNDHACIIECTRYIGVHRKPARFCGALVKLVANSYNSTQGQRAFLHLAF
ncbi:hypothetical protein SAMN04490195_3676 [Pseudomonas moorei]|uniref:Uncharacterized protein n=1 Tax=Pseudomonas moorei TaxID=395599 RepID=A0A1H1H034_9PSED|nr:hypothetical protein SAMN04490195_3676 [Pseudomonas moorei]